jgi:hypothetical protein
VSLHPITICQTSYKPSNHFTSYSPFIMRIWALLACLPLLCASGPHDQGAQPRDRKRACARQEQDQQTSSSAGASQPTDVEAAQPSLTPAVDAVAAVSTAAAGGFNYGTEKIRGVNIGGVSTE